jgi:hypothetical protein
MTQVLHHLMQRGTVEKLCASKKCKGKPMPMPMPCHSPPIAAKFEPVTVVAVVGMGHVKGIRANWARHIDANNLLT